MNFVQSPNGLYQTNPSCSLSYNSSNIAGNLGVAWCFCATGTLPGVVTDSNGNTWCLGNQAQASANSVSVFVCPKFKAGTNTVSCTFGTTSGIDVSFHVEEYSYNNPAAFLALQTVFASVFFTKAWGVLGGYTWGSSPWQVTHYYQKLSSNIQQPVTVTTFLGLYDAVAPPHGWGGNVRSETEQSTNSTVSGEYTVASTTQKVFTPGFGVMYLPGPQNQPANTYTGFMIVEL